MERREIIIASLLGVAVILTLSLYAFLVRERAHTASLTEYYTTELSTATGTIARQGDRIAELESVLNDTRILLERTVTEKDTLSKDLEEEKDRNDAFERQIKKIGTTVGTLDKLAKTDPELLQKYSKVYFLNENYMPAKLVPIEKEGLYNAEVPKFIEGHVEPFLTDMLEAALDNGVKILVVSAFRSFDEQRDLKGQYSVTYGTGANTFSADQGYSEHQLGTTVDFTTEGINGTLNSFEGTTAYEWLFDNAYKFGFVLSYPKDNAYYIFEPWHWRFVGTDLARALHKDGKYFYDLDQREIDTYLVSIFD